MKKIIFLIIATISLFSVADAKISFGTFMKKGLLSAIKENNDKNKLASAQKSLDAINGFNDDNTETEELDADDVRNFIIDINDNRYQWSQGKTKNQKSLMTYEGLLVQNNVSNSIYSSIVELPIDVESENFTFGVVVLPTKLKDDTGYALIFDYQDDHNFKAIVANETQYSYMIFNNGSSSIVKTGLIKWPKKATMNMIYFNKDGSNISFYIDDLEYGFLKNVNITTPVFGFGVLGKTSATILKMIFNVDFGEEVEQSTTTN